MVTMPQFSCSYLVYRFADISQHMKLVEDDSRVAAMLLNTGFIGHTHIHAHLSDRMPVPIVFFQGFDKACPGLFIFSFSSKNHPLSQQISKYTDILMPLTDAHLIDSHTAHVGQIQFRIGAVHMSEEHSPEPRVALLSHFSHFSHRHLPHQQ